MMAILAYTQLEILANMKIEMSKFEHEGRQLHPREKMYKHIVQVSNMVQTNHHRCLQQTLYQTYLKNKIANY